MSLLLLHRKTVKRHGRWIGRSGRSFTGSPLFAPLSMFVCPSAIFLAMSPCVQISVIIIIGDRNNNLIEIVIVFPSFFLISHKITYNLHLSLWFYLFVEQPVVFCFPSYFLRHSHFYGLLVWLYAVFLLAEWQSTQKELGANTVRNDFIKGRRFGRNSMIAKQSQTLVGFAQKYYIQGSFHLNTSTLTFFPFFISTLRHISGFLWLCVFSGIK